jgi:hypothetical protein
MTFGNSSRAILRQLRSVLLLSMLLAPGCQKTLPTAPSDILEGIVVYEHADFRGASAHIAEDISDLRDFKGPCVEFDFSGGVSSSTDVWNDCISSIRVAPGWSATLYRDTGYRDDEVIVTNDVANLTAVNHNCPKGGLNDCVSSIRIRRP